MTGPPASPSAAGAGEAGASGAGLGAGLGALDWPVFAAAPGLGAAPPPGFGAAAPPGLGAAFFGAAGFAADFLAPEDAPAPPPASNASVNLRTTGASIVEDAERTNSPSSLSLAMTTLLSTPSSFASSYTRTLATSLLTVRGAHPPPDLRYLCMGVLIAYSSSAHRNLDLLPTREVPLRTEGSERTVLRFRLLDLLHLPGQLCHVERARAAKGPVESPSADSLSEAGRRGMQIRAPTWQRTAKIRDTAAPAQHHTQQIRFVRALPTAHASALWACSD